MWIIGVSSLGPELGHGAVPNAYVHAWCVGKIPSLPFRPFTTFRLVCLSHHTFLE